MYTVYLIDDQKLIVQSIEKMTNWGDYDFEVKGLFYNGLEAYEAIKRNVPDLILVDIVMPIINGLELIQKLKEENINTKVIILSAHSQFEFAKKAIELGVDGYLLKPLDEDELECMISKIQDKLRQEKQQYKNNNIVELVENYISDMHINIFNKIIDKKTELQEIKILFEKLGIEIVESNYMYIVIQLLSDFNNNERAITEMNIINTINDTLNLFHESTCMYLSRKKILCLIKDEKNRMHPISKRMIVKKIDEQLELLNFKGSFTVATDYTNYKNVKQTLKNLYTVSNLYFYDPKRLRMMDGSNLMCSYETINFQIENKKEILERILIESEFENIEELKSLLDRIKEQKNVEVELLYKEFDKLFTYIEKELNSRSIDLEPRSDITDNYTLPQFEKYIKKYINEYITKLSSKDDSMYTIDLAKKYAQEHIKDEISLDKIEDELNITKNYFCYLFKESTGETFWDYITRIRVEKAKQLLSTNMKNYEIAQEVGYENPSYLSKVFKKYVGCTPSQYRIKLKKVRKE